MSKLLERIPELACPECRGTRLLEEEQAISCQDCRHVYPVCDGVPHMAESVAGGTDDEIAVQDRVASEYEEKRYSISYAREYHAWWIRQMLSRVDSDKRIFDNGCGAGILGDYVASEHIVGLDVSTEMLKLAKRRLTNLIRGDSQRLPIRDQSFDVVFCRSLLHHLPSPSAALSEMHRILRPDGEIVLVETNTSILSYIPRIIARRGEHFSEEHHNLGRRVLTELMSPYFRVDEVMFFGYLAYPLLGFPDLVRIFEVVPFKRAVAAGLMAVDRFLSIIPLLRTQSWGILIKGSPLPLSSIREGVGRIYG